MTSSRSVVRAAPYETLSRDVLEGVLGMLAGAYPSDEFAELKPRVVWDRVTDVVKGRQRRPGRGDHERRHDPGPRPVRGVHGRRGRHARTPRRRARRGDGLREPGRRRSSRSAPAAGGSRRSATTGSRSARRRASRASSRSGTATPSGARSSSARRIGAFIRETRGRSGARGARPGDRHRTPAARRTTSTTGPPRTCWPTSRTSRRPRARCPRTDASSSSGSAMSWATGGCAC